MPGPRLLPSGHLRTASTLARRPHLYDRGPVVDARQTDSAWGKLREQIGQDWGGLGSSEPTDDPEDVPMAALLNARPLERPMVLSRVNRRLCSMTFRMELIIPVAEHRRQSLGLFPALHGRIGAVSLGCSWKGAPHTRDACRALPPADPGERGSGAQPLDASVLHLSEATGLLQDVAVATQQGLGCPPPFPGWCPDKCNYQVGQSQGRAPLGSWVPSGEALGPLVLSACSLNGGGST